MVQNDLGGDQNIETLEMETKKSRAVRVLNTI